MEESDGIYEGFARVYDRFMDNVSYDEWYEYLHGLLEKHGVHTGLVTELACGTGEITKRLLASGYQVIGTDLSEEMLALAREKCGAEVLLLHQDMRRLEIPIEADAVVCVGDGINYLQSWEEFSQVAQLVYDILGEQGVFIFDLKTDYYFREIVGDRTITDNREDASYIWENSYDKEKKRNTYLLTVYELADDDRDLFVRSDEIHHQQVFEVSNVQKILTETGFFVKGVYEAFSGHEPLETSERIYIAAEKRTEDRRRHGYSY